MKKNVILRNMERLIYSDANSENEPLEPMSEWKWNKIYQLAQDYHIGAWVADGIRCYDGNFFLNISPTLKQRFLEMLSEKHPEYLSRFQLDIDRKSSLRKRLSRHSLQVYADDFIKTIKSIEE